MELHILLGGLRRAFLLVVVLGVLGFGVGLALSYDDSSSASTAVSLDPGDSFVGDPDRYIDGEISIITSPPVAADAAALIPGTDAGDVLDSIEVTQRAGSNVVDIRASADTDDEAVRISGAVADAYLARHRNAVASDEQERLAAADTRVVDLQRQIDTVTAGLTGGPGDAAAQARLATLRLNFEDALRGRQDAAVAVRDLATDDTAIVDPAEVRDPGRSASQILFPALGAIGGAALGLLAGIVRTLSAPRLQTRRQLEYLVGQPALAEIRTPGARDATKSFALFEPSTGLDELSLGLRRVAAAVASQPPRREPRCVALVDPSGTTGGHRIAAALGNVFAEDRHRVALIPIWSWRADASEGLAEKALAMARARPSTPPTETDDRSVELGDWEGVFVASNRVVVTPLATNPGPLDARRLDAIRSALAAHVDIVVLALPPVLESPAAASAAAHADDVVLLVPIPEQNGDQLVQVLEMLDGQDGPAIHLVVARNGHLGRRAK